MDNKSQKNPIVIPAEIRAYLERLMEDAHVLVVDEKEKDEVVMYLFEKLDKYMAAKIVENMKPEDTESFIKMTEEKKPQEEIDAFIQSHMENPQEVFTRAFVDFRDFYLTGQSDTAENAPDGKNSSNSN
ncbi:MAG TPA: hypothetical protein VN711_03490 [Candidatus Saccharimonadales bacterium]|nr:hypothetical protein [Candidatus Saccharimonadales bacterium]